MLRAVEYLALGAALVFALCLVALMFFYGSPSAPSEAPQQQHSEKHEPVQSKREAEKPFWEKATTDPVAAFTLFLVIFTAVLSGVGVIQLKLLTRAETVAEKSANAAKEAADAARDQIKLSREVFIADQRPWISLKVSIAGPLAYDDAGWQAGTRWHIPLNYQLRHQGKSPATNVDFFAKILPFTNAHWPDEQIKDGKPEGAPVPGVDIEKEFEEVCRFGEGFVVVNMGRGRVLLPGDLVDTEQFGLNGNPALFEAAKASKGYMNQFIVIACVTYGSPLSQDRYRTAHAFLLWKKAGDQRINLAGETIPLADLGFAPYPLKESHIR